MKGPGSHPPFPLVPPRWRACKDSTVMSVLDPVIEIKTQSQLFGQSRHKDDDDIKS